MKIKDIEDDVRKECKEFVRDYIIDAKLASRAPHFIRKVDEDLHRRLNSAHPDSWSFRGGDIDYVLLSVMDDKCHYACRISWEDGLPRSESNWILDEGDRWVAVGQDKMLEHIGWVYPQIKDDIDEYWEGENNIFDPFKDIFIDESENVISKKLGGKPIMIY